MTSTYELTVVYSPLAADQQKKAFESLEQLVKSRGGEVLSSEVLGKRNLAYPIKKQTEGVYGVLLLVLAPDGPAAIDADLRVNEEVLRYLLIKTKDQGLGLKDKSTKKEKPEDKEEKPERKTAKMVNKLKKVSKKK